MLIRPQNCSYSNIEGIPPKYAQLRPRTNSYWWLNKFYRSVFWGWGSEFEANFVFPVKWIELNQIWIIGYIDQSPALATLWNHSDSIWLRRKVRFNHVQYLAPSIMLDLAGCVFSCRISTNGEMRRGVIDDSTNITGRFLPGGGGNS